MEKLKNIFSKSALQTIAREIKPTYPQFPQEEFVEKTWRTIRNLELKDRVREISRSLSAFLPQNFEEAVGILQSAVKSDQNSDGIQGFLAWPFLQFIEDFGLDHFEVSVNAIRAMTPAMSGEFAIRPFLIRYPEKTLKALQSWTQDPNHHVRRLVSEGSRPLLPWGQQLPLLKKEPELSFDLLRRLKDSQELYVKKSIANHLNDISKNHPDKLLKELRLWRKQNPQNEHLEWIFRHGLRTLVKKGHQPSLQFLGYNGSLAKLEKLEISPKRVMLGDTLKVEARLRFESSGMLMLDYAVHHKKANGSLSAKVFKWKKLKVKKGNSQTFQKNHSIKKITTRTYYGGEHILEIFCNGISVGRTPFKLIVK